MKLMPFITKRLEGIYFIFVKFYPYWFNGNYFDLNEWLFRVNLT